MGEMQPAGLAAVDAPVASANEALLDALVAARRENEQLRQALRSRVVIEQAKGVLAERFATEVDVAFEVLRRASRTSQRRLHDLAAEVVASPTTPVEVARQWERLGR